MSNAKMPGAIAVVLALIAGVATVPAHADAVENLVTFTAGATARAAEVNGNFSEVADSVNDNDARIAALEAEIAALRQQLSNVLNVDPYLSLETVHGQPAVRITAANLQVVNGMDSTATANGTGNILIGYDEESMSAAALCSLGTMPEPGSETPITNESECVDAGGVWGPVHKSGSHYLVVGSEHNYSRWGGILAGFRNTGNFDYAAVAGGARNVASGLYASVGGGSGNVASGSSASVSGGSLNTASGRESSISGGQVNRASELHSSVSGGRENAASGRFSSVSGGLGNEAVGISSSVSGGASRSAPTDLDWVGGSLTEDD